MVVALLVIGPLLACVTSGESSSNPASDFAVHVEVNHYLVGKRSVYAITPTTLVISHATGEAQLRQVFQRRLATKESRSIKSLLQRLPLGELKPEYVNRQIEDGFGITFELSLGGSPPKTVYVENMPQPDLAELCSEINRLVPRRYAIPDLTDREFGDREPNNHMQVAVFAVTARARNARSAPAHLAADAAR